MQRELHYAIVDEVDNILIDEARTPLIISGPAEESTDSYVALCPPGAAACSLRRTTPLTRRCASVTLTEEGISAGRAERWASTTSTRRSTMTLTPYLENALKAEVLFKLDRDYIVKDGQVIIVDEFTGRLMFGRRYSEGLHQAIEAKEGVRVQRESLTLATITFQNYFRMYQKLAGMTGTAATEAEEFQQIYNLDVVVIPTHKPMIRAGPSRPGVQDRGGQVPRRGRGDRGAAQAGPARPGGHDLDREVGDACRDAAAARASPTRCSTPSSTRRKRRSSPRPAGPAAVTIATNMAGRGVDILLGGNPEGLARDELRRAGRGPDAGRRPRTWERSPGPSRAKPVPRTGRRCWTLGGLHVIGTERHEARRIDNQLRGRAGRQGDPGSSRFYRLPGRRPDAALRRPTVASMMDRLGVDEDIPIEHGLISKLHRERPDQGRRLQL